MSPLLFPQARRRRAASAVDGMHNSQQAVSQHVAVTRKSAISITSFCLGASCHDDMPQTPKATLCRGLHSHLGLTCQDSRGLDGSDLRVHPAAGVTTTAEALCNRHVSDTPGSTRHPKTQKNGFGRPAAEKGGGSPTVRNSRFARGGREIPRQRQCKYRPEGIKEDDAACGFLLCRFFVFARLSGAWFLLLLVVGRIAMDYYIKRTVERVRQRRRSREDIEEEISIDESTLGACEPDST